MNGVDGVQKPLIWLLKGSPLTAWSSHWHSHHAVVKLSFSTC